MREELGRIRRVSDLLCTAHAGLRDRFSRRAFLLDILIIGISTWLVALSFVAPRVNISLTPPGLDDQVWLGLLSIITFFLSIVQFKTDWKGRADSHKRSLDTYAEVKREAGYLLAGGEISADDCRRVLARYDMASAVGIEIPEKDFLSQKRRHQLKIALSKHLDSYPAASVLVTRARFWMRDNFGKPGRENV